MTGTPDLTDWWLTMAAKDAEHASRKRAEYGSRDLVHLGRVLLELRGQEHHNPNIEARLEFDPDDLPQAVAGYAAEVGVLFYLQGKISRALEAIRLGQQPSQDTYDDLRIYSTMLTRIRETGKW